MNKRAQKIFIYIMLICMLLTTILTGISMFW
ncbi:stressosome-associated protein Prli42 [Ectobacillus sp. sgz5001026]